MYHGNKKREREKEREWYYLILLFIVVAPSIKSCVSGAYFVKIKECVSVCIILHHPAVRIFLGVCICLRMYACCGGPCCKRLSRMNSILLSQSQHLESPSWLKSIRDLSEDIMNAWFPLGILRQIWFNNINYVRI